MWLSWNCDMSTPQQATLHLRTQTARMPYMVPVEHAPVCATKFMDPVFP